MTNTNGHGHGQPESSHAREDSLGKDDWRAQALCAALPVGQADAMFFPKRGESSAAAKLICSGCPVRAECLDFALGDVDACRYGIWGGTSGKERSGRREWAV